MAAAADEDSMVERETVVADGLTGSATTMKLQLAFLQAEPRYLIENT